MRFFRGVGTLGTDAGSDAANLTVAKLIAVGTCLKAQLEILDAAGYHIVAAKLSHAVNILDEDVAFLQANRPV